MHLGREVWQLGEGKARLTQGISTHEPGGRTRTEGQEPALRTRAVFSLLHPSQMELKRDYGIQRSTVLRTACAIRGPEGFAANISVHCKGDTFSPSIMLLQHKPGNTPINSTARFHSFDPTIRSWMPQKTELDRLSPDPPCTGTWPPHMSGPCDSWRASVQAPPPHQGAAPHTELPPLCLMAPSLQAACSKTTDAGWDCTTSTSTMPCLLLHSALRFVIYLLNSHMSSSCCVSQNNWGQGERDSQSSTARRWKKQVTRAVTTKQHSFAELDTKIEAKALKLLFNALELLIHSPPAVPSYLLQEAGVQLETKLRQRIHL